MIPERYAPQTYALMRIVLALIVLNYGLQKFGMFGGVDGQGGSAPFLSWPFGVAGVIECITGVLLLIGLLTRLAAFIASGEMAVAYFIYHFPMGGTPVQNMGMTAVILCFVWLHVAARGAGIWSVDAMRGSK